VSFASLIGIGTLCLSLPVASSDRTTLPVVDAVFQSTSAVCVTGLSTIDVGTKLSLFGQLVILVLMQLGGLGVMTYSLLLVTLVQKAGSPDQREWLANVITSDRKLPPQRMLMWIFKLVFVSELIGALVLAAAFWRNHGPLRSVYLAVFHAVSAFCNAGFSPFSTSLVAYRDDPVVNLTIMALIITGGLGFIVTFELWRWMTGHRRWFKLLLQTKLVVFMTACLIIFGMAAFLLLELGNTLRGTAWSTRLWTSAFQSVTARTAGFSTVNIGDLTNGTLVVLIPLMFVGAGSGSTAGGVKVTTAGVLLFAVLSRLRGTFKPQAWNRSISLDTVARAAALFAGAAILVMMGTFVLQITELGDLPHAASRGMFLDILFEATSAWGTVGLSTGITPTLTTAGRLVIIMLMFVGRVGPLTFAAILISRARPRAEVYYPEENVMIG
jgi:trk system potassium uptake protein TrkH